MAQLLFQIENYWKLLEDQRKKFQNKPRGSKGKSKNHFLKDNGILKKKKEE
jgi:hypothetical protein